MRQMIAVVVMMVVSGCTEGVSPPAPPVAGACPEFATFAGDVTITSAADLDAFAAQGCVAVAGKLIISGPDITTVNLPSLVQAEALDIKDCPLLVTVTLPALGRIPSGPIPWVPPAGHVSPPDCIVERGGGLNVTNVPRLETLSMPSLTVVGGATIEGGAGPGLLTLPVLRETSRFESGCASGLRFGGSWSSIELPSLEYGSIAVTSSALNAIDLPRLVLGNVMAYATSLTSLSLPSLVGGDVLINDNDALNRIDLPALQTTGTLYAFSNGTLEAMAVPALTQATVIDIRDNASYPQCAADAIVTQLATAPAVVLSYGNDTTATCPP